MLRKKENEKYTSAFLAKMIIKPKIKVSIKNQATLWKYIPIEIPVEKFWVSRQMFG